MFQTWEILTSTAGIYSFVFYALVEGAFGVFFGEKAKTPLALR